MIIKTTLIKMHDVLSTQFGIYPCRFWHALRGVPSFLRDRAQFRRGYSGKMILRPCLHDRSEEGGTTKSEYFWQDLLVARWIHDAHPQRHVDIGSRVDGFVAHVASFREIEVFDVRPISTLIPGVVFRRADLMKPDSLSSEEWGSCDSLSCLHAIEHFGLGRYGDRIDPRGYEQGLANMAKLLKPNGRFYLSTPIGQERVEFNSHWVFDPRSIIRCAGKSGLQLQQLTMIGAGGAVRTMETTEAALREFSQNPYNLGIFVFRKGE